MLRAGRITNEPCKAILLALTKRITASQKAVSRCKLAVADRDVAACGLEPRDLANIHSDDLFQINANRIAVTPSYSYPTCD